MVSISGLAECVKRDAPDWDGLPADCNQSGADSRVNGFTFQ